MKDNVTPALWRNEAVVHYWAETDAAGKVTIKHRSKEYSDFCGTIERLGPHPTRGRHALQIVVGSGTFRIRLDMNVREDRGYSSVIYCADKAKEGEEDYFLNYEPFPMPQTEDDLWVALAWAVRERRQHKKLLERPPPPKAKRRGRPEDERIWEQQRKR